MTWRAQNLSNVSWMSPFYRPTISLVPSEKTHILSLTLSLPLSLSISFPLSLSLSLAHTWSWHGRNVCLYACHVQVGLPLRPLPPPSQEILPPFVGYASEFEVGRKQHERPTLKRYNMHSHFQIDIWGIKAECEGRSYSK